MNYEKKRLNFGDRVKLINTTSPLLDGRTGTIYGKNIVNIFDHYIVLLDDDPIVTTLFSDDYETTHQAITMTEVCLEKL